MARSVWKLPFIRFFFFKHIFKSPEEITFFCRHRDTTLIDFFLKAKFGIYSGKSFKSFSVTPGMLGHKLGEFSFSKIRGVAVTESLILKEKRKKKEKSKGKSKGKVQK